MYELNGKQTVLLPFNEDKLEDFHKLLTADFIRASLLYEPPLNFCYSSQEFEAELATPRFKAGNRLYLINDRENGQLLGITGLYNINWIQKRTEIILLMSKDKRRQKMMYEPLKLLLLQALNEWQLAWFQLKIFAEDQVTATVLKAFGFTQYGEIKEFVKIDQEYYDLSLQGLRAQDFHTVDY